MTQGEIRERLETLAEGCEIVEIQTLQRGDRFKTLFEVKTGDRAGDAQEVTGTFQYFDWSCNTAIASMSGIGMTEIRRADYPCIKL